MLCDFTGFDKRTRELYNAPIRIKRDTNSIEHYPPSITLKTPTYLDARNNFNLPLASAHHQSHERERTRIELHRQTISLRILNVPTPRNHRLTEKIDYILFAKYIFTEIVCF